MRALNYSVGEAYQPAVTTDVTIIGLTTDLTNFTNASISCNNCTAPDDKAALQNATKIVLTCTLIFIMLAVGCHIDVKDLWVHLRRPFGIVIGFLAQFVLLPLAAWGMGHALELPRLQALGMLVMSCCPGGSLSNLFTYWADGDVSLSVSMTTINTALSSGMLPFNLWLYGRNWSQQTAVIPYRTIAESFAMVVLPATLGIFIRWKLPKTKAVIVKIGNVVGVVSVVLTDILMVILYPGMFNVSWRMYVAIITLPTLSFFIGYIFAWAVRMTPQRRRTVSLETAIQNFPLCMTLLALSFDREELGQLVVYPLLFGVFIIGQSVLFVAFSRLFATVQARMGKKQEMTYSNPLPDKLRAEDEDVESAGEVRANSDTPMIKPVLNSK